MKLIRKRKKTYVKPVWKVYYLPENTRILAGSGDDESNPWDGDFN